MVPAISVLATISEGDSLYLEQPQNTPPLSVLAVYPTTGDLLVLADPSGGGEPEFIASMYEYPGGNTAKLSLRWSDEDYWLVGSESGTVEKPLITGPGDPAQFLLTDTGSGVTMEVIYPGDLGYVGVTTSTGQDSLSILTYGNGLDLAVPLTILVEP